MVDILLETMADHLLLAELVSQIFLLRVNGCFLLGLVLGLLHLCGDSSLGFCLHGLGLLSLLDALCLGGLGPLLGSMGLLSPLGVMGS